MKKTFLAATIVLMAMSARAAMGPAGDGALECSTSDGKITVEIQAQDGFGKGEIKSAKSTVIEGADTTAVVARSSNGQNLLAVVSKGSDLIEVSASGFYTAYCSGCSTGSSFNYQKATLSKSSKGVLTTFSGLSCTFENDGEK